MKQTKKLHTELNKNIPRFNQFEKDIRSLKMVA